MLKVVRLKRKKMVSAVQFYDVVVGDSRNYARWIKQYITDHPAKMPQEGHDYVIISKKQTGPGRQRKDILISIDFLKHICFDLKTQKCKLVLLWANAL